MSCKTRASMKKGRVAAALFYDHCNGLLLQQTSQRLAQIRRRLHRGDARLLQSSELGRRRALAAGDDRTGMAHALAGRSRGTRDERHHWLLDVFANELSGFFLGATAY